MDCYSYDRNIKITEVGKNSRFKKGNISPFKINPLLSPRGINHSLWKGDNVGYRGIHYWVRREKGIPKKCSNCGSIKNVQWANIDHQYKRDINDYIELCSSCHKKRDLALRSVKYKK